MRRLLTWSAAVWLLGTAAGCGTSDDQRQARHAAEVLYADVAAHRGAAACRELTPDAASALAQQEGEPCAVAVTKLKLSGSRAVRTDVFETNGVAAFDGGELAFVERTRMGWRVSAAGCTPKGDEPADCEVED